MVNLGRNEVSEFHYSTTLTASAQAIVPAYSSAAADKYKKIRITDLKVTSGGTAANYTIEGESGNFAALEFSIPADSFQNFSWVMPYPLDITSTTGASRTIFASASAVNVKIALSGYYDKNE